MSGTVSGTVLTAWTVQNAEIVRTVWAGSEEIGQSVGSARTEQAALNGLTGLETVQTAGLDETAKTGLTAQAGLDETVQAGLIGLDETA